jgi:Ca-activated chloride channel family protein
MAALQVPAGRPRDSVNVKLLVDCSGSMAGDSIVSACAALRSVVAGLREVDSVSLSRFGSSVLHAARAGVASDAGRAELRRAIDGIEADMGGTEMEEALSRCPSQGPIRTRTSS